MDFFQSQIFSGMGEGEAVQRPPCMYGLTPIHIGVNTTLGVCPRQNKLLFFSSFEQIKFCRKKGPVD